jgi:hypothetical protein
MKTVAHLNLIGPGFPNTGWQKAFKENGFEDYIGIDWVRIKNKHGYEKMWTMIINSIKKQPVDLVFMQIQSAGALTGENVMQIKSATSAKVVLYNIDARYPEEVQWIYNASHELDYCALSNQRDVDYINMFTGKAGLVQSSCDMDFYHRTEHDVFSKEHDIVFLANNYQNTSRRFPLCEFRQELIEELYRKFPSNFECYGRRQQNPVASPFMERELYNKSKIAISCSNFDLEGYTSDRIWRAMASGCFVLAKYFKGAEKILVQGHHLDWWATKEQLTEKILYYMRNPIARNQIAKRGMDHVRANHTLTHRVKQILEAL